MRGKSDADLTSVVKFPEIRNDPAELEKELPSQYAAGDSEKQPLPKSATIDLSQTKASDATQTGTADIPEDPFSHLPEHEREVLKTQLDVEDQKVSFFGLYRYASKNDILIIIVSAICSIAAGAALPLFTVSSLFLVRHGECVVDLWFIDFVRKPG